MTPLSRAVKTMLLKYPSLMPNRVQVLIHLYLTSGSGIKWTPDGEMNIGEDHVDVLEFESVVNHMNVRAAMYSKNADGWEDVYEMIGTILYVFERNQIYHDRRDFIDEMASTPDTKSIIQYFNDEAPSPELFQKQRTALKLGLYGEDYTEAYRIAKSRNGNAFCIPDNAEQSFFDGAIEILNTIIRSSPSLEGAAHLMLIRDRIIARRQK